MTCKHALMYTYLGLLMSGRRAHIYLQIHAPRLLRVRLRGAFSTPTQAPPQQRIGIHL